MPEHWDISGINGEGIESSHSVGRVVVLTIDHDTGKTFALRSNKGVLRVETSEGISLTETLDANTSYQQAFTGPAKVDTVINTTTGNLELHDGTVAGDKELIAVLLPGMAMPAAFSVATGLVLKSVGIGVVGVSSVLYALNGG